MSQIATIYETRPDGYDNEAYWAAAEPEKAAQECMDRITRIGRLMEASGALTRRVRSLRTYYGQDTAFGPNVGSTLRPAGEQGEVLLMRVNQYRNFGLHIVNLVTRDVLNYDTITHDDGPTSRAASQLAKDLLKNVTREKKVDALVRLAAEWAVTCDSAYILLGWDPTIGPSSQLPNPDGTERKMGDVRIEVFGPHDIFTDLRSTKQEKDWYIIRRWVNRWDLVAKYPEMRDEILSFPTREKLEMPYLGLWGSVPTRSDEIAMFELRHAKTPAVTKGRLMTFCDQRTVFFDGPLPYDTTQLHCISAGAYLDSGASYTSMYDALGLQEGYDAAWSTMVSVADMAGMPNYLAANGSNFNVEDIAGAARLVTWDPVPGIPNGGKPEIMQIPPVPEATMKVLEMAPATMGVILAVNEVTRGQPPDQVKAGNYAALLAQQTAEFWTPLRKSVVEAAEGVGQDVLSMYSHPEMGGAEERMIETEGLEKGKRIASLLKGSLTPVKRVVCKVGNPLTATPAGKRMLADTLAEHKWIDRNEYLEVTATGEMDPVIDPVESEAELIKWENEQMLQAQVDPTDPKAIAMWVQANVPVVQTDDPMQHIAKHKCVLHDPSARLNPSTLALMLAHITMHMQQMIPMSPAPGAGPTQQPGAEPGTGPSQQPGAAPPQPGGAPGEGGGANPQAQQAGVKMPVPAKPPANAPPPAGH